MTKSSYSASIKSGRNTVSGRYVTVGRTSDGVNVLEPSKPAKHFTAREARKVITAHLESTNRK